MDAIEPLAAAAGIVLRTDVPRDWATIEQSVGGLRLPTEYKRFVDGFPHGRFKELVTVIRPGIEGGAENDYLGFYAGQLEDIRGWRADGYGSYPYPIFPEDQGVLPWGYGPRGELFFWLTEDTDPDRWPVVWADSDYREWHRHPVSMSEFLLRLAAGPPPEELTELIARDFSGTPVIDVAAAPPFRSFETAPSVEIVREPLGAIPRGIRTAASEPKDESGDLLKALGARPVVATDRDWPAIERRWSLRFPGDYRGFYDSSGPGVFCDIAVVGPDGPDGWNTADLLRAAHGHTYAEYITFYPESAGVVPWGATPDGYIFGWQPRDTDPQRWGLSVVGTGSQRIEFPELSFSAFLLYYSGVREGYDVSLPGRPSWSGPLDFKGLQG